LRSSIPNQANAEQSASNADEERFNASVGTSRGASRPQAGRGACVRPELFVTHPAFSASVMYHWSLQFCGSSLYPHMRPQEPHAISSAGPAQGGHLEKRGAPSHWLQILVAAAGLTLFSSVAGLFVYDWYFDSVLAGLASSLQPFSNAFHQLNGDRVRPAPSRPAN
jgi:hypothetical protein